MTRLPVAFAIAIALALGSFSQAATITQSQGFVGTPDVARHVEFDRFNPNYGELVSAEWRFELDIEGGSHTVDNDSATAKTVSVSLGARGSLLSNEVPLVDASMSPILYGGTAVTAVTSSVLELAVDDGDGGVFDPTGPDANTHTGGFGSATGSGIVNPQHLGDYIGTEMFQLWVEIDQLAELSESVEISGQTIPVTVWPNIVLTYEYQPVPEPVGLTFVTLALILFVPLSRINGGTNLRQSARERFTG